MTISKADQGRCERVVSAYDNCIVVLAMALRFLDLASQGPLSLWWIYAATCIKRLWNSDHFNVRQPESQLLQSDADVIID